MRRYLRRAWRDIRRGESIDAYVSITLAAVLTVLSLVDVVPESWTAAVTLSVLALLATGILGNRYRLEVIQDRLSRTADEVLVRTLPADLEANLEKGSEVWFVGASLNRTSKNYYALIEGKLQRGQSVRVVVRDPEGETCDLIVRHAYRALSVGGVRDEIRLALSRFCSLQAMAPGRLEIRVIDHHLSFGMFAVDPDKPNGTVYVEHYPYKISQESLPKLVLCPEDGYWYDFYRAQLEAVWANATPWQCGGR